MDRDEQRRIIEFIETAGKSKSGAPAVNVDVEADAIIRALFVRNPEAAYRVTMQAITQAQELAWLRGQLADMLPAKHRGFFARLFGGRRFTHRDDAHSHVANSHVAHHHVKGTVSHSS